MWMLEKATLNNLVHHATTNGASEGVLTVTVKNKITGTELNGTVCVKHFDSNTAGMFCQFLDFATGWWKNDLKNKEDFR